MDHRNHHPVPPPQQVAANSGSPAKTENLGFYPDPKISKPEDQ
jgi:hypothetical protein